MDQGQPDAIHPLIERLNEALALESKFQPHLHLPNVAQEPGEITAGMRDGSAHVLRCLKVWYDLPSNVLFVAINLMDRFLSKMKARPKHLACIAVSCFHLAARQVAQQQQQQPTNSVSEDAIGIQPPQPFSIPEPKDLVAISQCKCTLGDLARMEAIIADKLSCEPGLLPVTSLSFLQLFYALFSVAAERLGIGPFYNKIVAPALWQRLEILACDAACSSFRSCEVALVLLCSQLDTCVADISTNQDPSTGADIMRLISFAIELQKICKIGDSSFICCNEVVLSILARYNAQCQMPHRQRLVWRLSQRTLRYLRPTDKLTSTLPTIDEHGQLQISSRGRSCSLSSEESTDQEKEEPSASDVEDWNSFSNGWPICALPEECDSDNPRAKCM